MGHRITEQLQVANNRIDRLEQRNKELEERIALLEGLEDTVKELQHRLYQQRKEDSVISVEEYFENIRR